MANWTPALGHCPCKVRLFARFNADPHPRGQRPAGCMKHCRRTRNVKAPRLLLVFMPRLPALADCGVDRQKGILWQDVCLISVNDRFLCSSNNTKYSFAHLKLAKLFLSFRGFIGPSNIHILKRVVLGPEVAYEGNATVLKKPLQRQLFPILVNLSLGHALSCFLSTTRLTTLLAQS